MSPKKTSPTKTSAKDKATTFFSHTDFSKIKGVKDAEALKKTVVDVVLKEIEAGKPNSPSFRTAAKKHVKVLISGGPAHAPPICTFTGCDADLIWGGKGVSKAFTTNVFTAIDGITA